MGKSWRESRIKRELERQLRARRSETSDQFVRSILSWLGAHPTRRLPALRTGYAVALTAMLLAAIAASGGLGYAGQGAKQAVNTLSALFKPAAPTATARKKPEDDQFEKECRERVKQDEKAEDERHELVEEAEDERHRQATNSAGTKAEKDAEKARHKQAEKAEDELHERRERELRREKEECEDRPNHHGGI